ncbi:hypothetical protein [Lacinutrix sp. Hel_I_90]|uniref:hypothetical protein n=1 Tax=Lacinutrix sp. Hel_I_90 TaxID=1249999 RepID=UPI0005C8E4E8|nr:hypothetical protein [Lacinutrix sp. Hel_I_90]
MQKIKDYTGHILPFLIISLLVSDFITSMVYKLSLSPFYRYSGYFKLFFEIIMVAVIVYNFKSLSKLHKVVLGLFLVFIASQLLGYSNAYDFSYHISTGNIYFFNRYIYILIFILFLNTINPSIQSYRKAYKYLEGLLFFNCLAISIGILFGVDVFKSYEYTARFGYAGLFSKPEEAAFIYCIAIIYNYYFWVLKKSRTHFLKTLLFIIVILLLGQKKMFLFVCLLLCAHLVYETNHKKIFRVLILFSSLVVLFFRTQIATFIFGSSPFWSRVYIENGFLSTITSNRDQLLKLAISHIRENWNIANYVFGGVDFNKYKVEFEVVDLYIFLGISGVFFYVYLLRNHFLKESNNLKTRLVIILFLTSFFGGGLLLSITATLLFYIVINKVMVTNHNA